MELVFYMAAEKAGAGSLSQSRPFTRAGGTIGRAPECHLSPC